MSEGKINKVMSGFSCFWVGVVQIGTRFMQFGPDGERTECSEGREEEGRRGGMSNLLMSFLLRPPLNKDVLPIAVPPMHTAHIGARPRS